MKNFKKYFFLFVCLMTLKKSIGNAGKLLKLNENAKEMGIMSKSIDSYESVILVNDQSYGIYVKDSNGSKEFEYNSSTLSKLYTCVNCEISKWIKQKLFKLIEYVPLFYRSIFFQECNNIFLESIKIISENPLEDVVTHIQRFVNVLLTFINIYLSEYDTSNDTQLLKTLLSLSFDINYINNEYEQTTKNEYSDNIIIRILLGALNSIRQFMLLNCSQYFYFRNNQLYVFSAHDYDTKNINIDTFLDDIRSLNLEVHDSCDVHQMTLENVIANQFGHIEWTTSIGTVNIEHVMQKIKKVRGLGKVFWYQKYMFNTIMKLLFTKILNHFEESKSLSKTIVTQIQVLYSNILEDITNIPSVLAVCFSLLMSESPHVYSEDNDLSIAIHAYLKSVENVNLETNTNDDERATVDLDGIGKTVKDHPIRSLEDYISYLNAIAKDLRCFVRLYEFLHSEIITEIGPSFERIEEMKSFEEEIAVNYLQLRVKKINYEGCQFFHGLQQYCMNAMMYNNMTEYHYDDEHSNNNYYFEFKYILHTMLTYLKNFNDGYLPHIKAVDSAALAIELIIVDNICCDSMNRLLHLIMTELDSYSIDFCNPPDFNFLSFNNINFELNGLLNTKIANIVKNSMTKVHRFTVFKRHFYSYSRVRSLNELFSKESKTFKFYDNSITLLWKGQNMNISDIRNNLMRTPVSSSSIYKVYGFFFKFALASLFYEIFIYNKLFPRTNKRKFIISPDELRNYFPMYFNGIIQGLLTLLANVSMPLNVVTSIRSQFEKMGIYIEFGQLDDDKVGSEDDYFVNSQTRIDKVLSFMLMTRHNLVNNALYNRVKFG